MITKRSVIQLGNSKVISLPLELANSLEVGEEINVDWGFELFGECAVCSTKFSINCPNCNSNNVKIVKKINIDLKGDEHEHTTETE